MHLVQSKVHSWRLFGLGDDASAAGAVGGGQGGAAHAAGGHDGLPDAAGPRPALRRRFATRGRAALDCDHEVPEGCKLRLYEPDDGAHYWRGELPDGKLGDGRKTKSATWGFYTQRSRDEAYDVVWQWLWEHGV